MIRVTLRIEGASQSEVVVLAAGTTTIGRIDSNDITLSHQFVSSRHAKVDVSADGATYTDLGSTNGTVINGSIVVANDPQPLSQDDTIIIGPFQIKVEISEIVEEVITIEEAVVVEPPPPAVVEPVKQPARAVPVTSTDTVIAEIPLLLRLPDLITQESQRLLDYLPGIYHTDFMTRFMGIFEGIYTPMEWTIDNFDLFLSPRTAPAGFLPWLGRWFDISFDATWGTAQKRLFLTEAHALFRMRGTRWGLARLLEIYTGSAPDIIDLDDDDDPFSFTVRLPVAQSDVNPQIVEQLINLNKPAHTTYKLFYRKG